MYQFTSDFGGGIILAPCLQTFCAEVQLATKLGLLDVTNLGQIGDTRHQGEGTGSDHNPWMQGPDGKWLVRALDFGGRDWAVLLEFWNLQYRNGNPRVRMFGYTNSNLSGKYTGLTIWGGDGSTRPGTDGAHGHHSANQANGYNPTPGRSGFVAALYDRSPWGLVAWLQSGRPTTNLSTADLEEDPFMGINITQAEWETVLGAAKTIRANLDEQNAVQKDLLDSMPKRVWDFVLERVTPGGGKVRGAAGVFLVDGRLSAAQAAAAAVKSGQVDPAALAAALAPLIEVPAGSSADPTAIATAVVDLLAQRVAS